jgi:hypothetical protein
MATNAKLNIPYGVTVDGYGNLYIADTHNNRIREVGINGIIATVAGNEGGGYFGDGGKATSASLNSPTGVAVDGFGNLFIADQDNNRIREVGTNGIITTWVGDGIAGSFGDELYYPRGVAVDGYGNLYIADTFNNRIRKAGNGIITTIAGGGNNYPGDGGAATNARLDWPSGVAVDGYGNLYIADYYNNRIREVGTNGIITTVAGNGGSGSSGDGGAATNAELREPAGVAVDGCGNLLIADYQNNRVREVGAGCIITTVAGNGTNGYSGDGGLAANAEINGPWGVTVDGYGNLFIADSGNQRIRKVTYMGTNHLVFQGVAAGNSGSYDVVVTSPYGSVTSSVVTLSAGVSPAITSQPTNLVLTVGGTATFSVAVSGSAPLNCQWQFDGTNLAGATNSILAISNAQFANAGTYELLVTNLYGETNSQSAVLGAPPSVATQPTNQAVGVGTNAAFSVSVSGTGPFAYQWQFDGTNLPNIITTVAGNGTGGYSGDGGVATNAELDNPYGVTMDGYGNLFIADTLNNRIREVGTNGIITTVAGNGSRGYSGDGGVATNAQLNNPYGVTMDGYGNLFIADQDNNRVREVGTNGIITTVAGSRNSGYSGDGGAATNAELREPEGVTLDGYGNLFIADTGNERIRKVGTSGIIATVAGGGSSGDGGQATNASLNYPEGVTVDVYGNLFIADAYNNRIRKVGTNGIITTVAGSGFLGYSGDGGKATNAELWTPSGVAADGYGNLFMADYNNDRIREVGTNGIITTKAGNGKPGYSGDNGAATNAKLNCPFGVTVDGYGNLFVADYDNNRIREIPSPGTNFVFPSVAISNAGSYDVVVTSPYGSVTSSVVTLTVNQITPVITPFSLSNFGFTSSNAFQIQFTNTPGATFSLWASTNLSNWTQIGTTTENSPGMYEASDSSATNCGARFYQLRWP